MAKRFFWFLVVAIVFMVVVGLWGCSPKTVYVPVETVRTEYVEADTTAIYNRLLKLFESRREKDSRSDSLVDRTKETVVLNEKGDTTRHYKTKYVYVSSKREKELEYMLEQADSLIHDMHTQLLSVKSDSISVPYPVERELSRWEQAKMDFGGIAFGGIGAAVIIIALLAWLARKRRK